MKQLLRTKRESQISKNTHFQPTEVEKSDGELFILKLVVLQSVHESVQIIELGIPSCVSYCYLS